jgi:hypothetical protein
MKRTIFLTTILFLVSILAACTLPFKIQNQADFIATAVEQTMQAKIAALPTAMVIAPADTPVPLPTSETVQVEATSTPECFHALLVSETIPDGTLFDPGDGLTKVWWLKNTGSCTWTPDYQLVFKSGDKMGGESAVYLTNYVKPGDQIEVAVNLTAPDTADTYSGYWQLLSDSGVRFAKIWAQIVVDE